MRAVVMVDAAPGFEAAVETALRHEPGVTSVARVKQGNYDMAVLLDTADAAVLQRLLSSRIPHISGVRGVMKVENPDSSLLQKLGASL